MRVAGLAEHVDLARRGRLVTRRGQPEQRVLGVAEQAAAVHRDAVVGAQVAEALGFQRGTRRLPRGDEPEGLPQGQVRVRARGQPGVGAREHFRRAARRGHEADLQFHQPRRKLRVRLHGVAVEHRLATAAEGHVERRGHHRERCGPQPGRHRLKVLDHRRDSPGVAALRVLAQRAEVCPG